MRLVGSKTALTPHSRLFDIKNSMIGMELGPRTERECWVRLMAPVLLGSPSAPSLLPDSPKLAWDLIWGLDEHRSRRLLLSFSLLFQAGNLTVLATDPLLHQAPVQLDFHFRLSPQTSAHWHGLLCDHRLFLDIPYRALDQGNRERWQPGWDSGEGRGRGFHFYVITR